MTKRRTVTKVIYEEEGRYGVKDPIPENLSDLIAWLQDKLYSLPEDMQGAAVCEIDARTSWEDSAVLEIKIEGRRPETDAEMAQRLREEVATRELKLRDQEANERAAYEALRKKYGGK